MASVAALSAAAQDRKSRLAQLKSLKRKQEALQQDEENDATSVDNIQAASSDNQSSEKKEDGVAKYLSGRNYDFETKGAKLGFETAPSDGQATLEKQAALLEADTKQKTIEEDSQGDQPLDLFKLQPRKPNWDLKRDLDRKLEVLNVRTDNAIARMVRERIAKQQQAARASADGSMGGGDAEAAGIEGTTLVEATNVREREDEEEARREREEEAILDEP